ncbi:MAG: presenilin family intramembrane aspartyl protease [archaeon]|nr:presenilin family intramembrane aspartyl protease [archaeon]
MDEVKVQVFSQLIILFLITQFLGLVVGYAIIQSGQQQGIITEDPNDVLNAVGLIVYILVFTAILLIAMKYYKGLGLFKGLEALVIFGTALTVFSVFFDWRIAMVLAIILILSRIAFKENIMLRNVASIIASVGAGALIGTALGLLPVVTFVILLSVYDYIAVFKTKHMITLAKGITKKNLSFTFAMPTKTHTFELGTGDMVIPLTFAVSVLGISSIKLAFPYNFIAPVLILFGSLAALILTIDYSSKNIGKALPALPPQAVTMIIMLAISFLFGLI